jgi:tRNA-Thr(GGU) m(6)t(6)A37 methyltransferase TsaA
MPRRIGKGAAMDIIFHPIGVVRMPLSDEAMKSAPHALSGTLEIAPQCAEALEGLDGYSHLVVLCYFHKLRPEQVGPLKVQPRRLLQRGFTRDTLPWLGVFALDSPTRPNPIGLTVVRFVERDGCRLRVEGLDYVDGTPILNIKGYGADYRPETYTVPQWYTQLMDARGHV